MTIRSSRSLPFALVAVAVSGCASAEGGGSVEFRTIQISPGESPSAVAPPSPVVAGDESSPSLEVAVEPLTLIVSGDHPERTTVWFHDADGSILETVHPEANGVLVHSIRPEYIVTVATSDSVETTTFVGLEPGDIIPFVHPPTSVYATVSVLLPAAVDPPQEKTVYSVKIGGCGIASYEPLVVGQVDASCLSRGTVDLIATSFPESTPAYATNERSIVLRRDVDVGPSAYFDLSDQTWGAQSSRSVSIGSPQGTFPDVTMRANGVGFGSAYSSGLGLFQIPFDIVDHLDVRWTQIVPHTPNGMIEKNLSYRHAFRRVAVADGATVSLAATELPADIEELDFIGAATARPTFTWNLTDSRGVSGQRLRWGQRTIFLPPTAKSFRIPDFQQADPATPPKFASAGVLAWSGGIFPTHASFRRGVGLGGSWYDRWTDSDAPAAAVERSRGKVNPQ